MGVTEGFEAMKGQVEKRSDVPGALWSASTKVRGLSEVFNMAAGDPPFSEEGLTGVGSILGAVADDLDHIRDIVEYGDLPTVKDGEVDLTKDDSAFVVLMREFTEFLGQRRADGSTTTETSNT